MKLEGEKGVIVLTGGAGFIGSCILRKLNELQIRDIIVVDHLIDQEIKKRNLDGKQFLKFYEKDEFLRLVLRDEIVDPINAVIHMGACSSTILTDEAYYEKNNYEYSAHLAQWSFNRGARFIYASSAATYGSGGDGYSDHDEVTLRLKPLNFYGEFKHKFDLWILKGGFQAKCVGLKFFNVFGPNEYHKGDMRSVIAKAYPQVVHEGVMRLFKSHLPQYADGEQKRDFIYVKDAVDVVIYFLQNREKNGIYNLGTGVARSWNDLAKALFAAVGMKPCVKYIDMPLSIRNQYQYFTEAEMEKLKGAGYRKPFCSLEYAVHDYVEYLLTGRCL